MLSLLASATTGAVIAAVAVRGETSCPTPEAVAARLEALVPGAAGTAPAPVRQAHLARDGAGLHIALHAQDGTPIARRTLPGQHSCEALAEAAAVIIAAWQIDIARGPLLAAEEAPPRARLELERPARAPALGPRWGLGAAGGLSLAGSSAAPAAAVSVTHAPAPAQAWAGRLDLSYRGPRELGLPGGQVRWQRWVLGAGPQLQGAAGATGWAFHLGPALGITRLEGRGLVNARDNTDFGLGVAGGARMSLGSTGLRPFLEIAARAWPTRIVAYEGGGLGQTSLPRLEGMLSAGAAIGR
jgi:hypothetical protein